MNRFLNRFLKFYDEQEPVAQGALIGMMIGVPFCLLIGALALIFGC